MNPDVERETTSADIRLHKSSGIYVLFEPHSVLEVTTGTTVIIVFCDFRPETTN